MQGMVFRTVGFMLAMIVFLGLLQGCERSHPSGMSAEQIAKDQKRYMLAVNDCFLREYSSLETFYMPIEKMATALRMQCADEFSALRAAKLNYAMVRDVIDPPPRMIQFEVEMAEIFVESARSRAMSLFKNHPPIPNKPKQPEQPEANKAF